MTQYETTCREALERAEGHYRRDPHPLNRRAVRSWRRRFWWARYGSYVCVVAGGFLGFFAMRYILVVAS